MVETIKVTGMHCGHCEGKVKKELFSFTGVNNVVADRYTNSVKVDFNSEEVSLDDIKQAITSCGYQVE